MSSQGCRCRTPSMIYKKGSASKAKLIDQVAEKIHDHWKKNIHKGAVCDVPVAQDIGWTSLYGERCDIKNTPYLSLPDEFQDELVDLAKLLTQVLAKEGDKEKEYKTIYDFMYKDCKDEDEDKDKCGGLYFSGLKEDREKKCKDVIEIAKKVIEESKTKKR
ncbi:hypothetical protein FB645_000118 [Coemansia sp. IMI 203386]|nr:hypothetical protein FB645_000118 [Coemansia sp. IMI 203386]